MPLPLTRLLPNLSRSAVKVSLVAAIGMVAGGSALWLLVGLPPATAFVIAFGVIVAFALFVLFNA